MSEAAPAPGSPTDARVLILGLDGATFSVLDPLMERGLMPELSRLVARGVRAPLRSTDPYVTAPAWTSLVTGKRPDTTGVFDWSVPLPASYQRRMLDSTFRQALSFWELLTQRGIPAGALNLPLSYPPSDQASFCVGDMFTPSPDADFTHPRALKAELHALGYQIDLRKRDFFGRGFDAYLEALIDMTRARGRGLRHCLEHFPWRAAIGVFTEPDRLQHPFWHHLDFQAENWSPETTRAAEFYRTLDEELGHIGEQVGADTHLYLVSDHGFGPHRGAFYANDWLEARGYLVRQQESPLKKRGRAVARGSLRRLGDEARRLARAHGGARLGAWQQQLELGLDRLRASLGESLTPDAPPVDWSRTRAFADTPHGIRINLAGREPEGVVSEAQLEPLCAALTRELLELRDPRDQQPLHAEVLPRGVRYPGQLSHLAPDLVYTFADTGYSWRIGSMAQLHFGRLLENAFLAVDTEWETGTHRPEGILIAAGPELRSGVSLPMVRIWDVLPTLLYHLDQQLPPDLEGRVLREAFDPQLLNARPERWGGPLARRASADPNIPPGSFPGPFNAQDEAAVADHLRSLGYLS